MTTNFIPYSGKVLNRLEANVGEKYGKLTITEILGRAKRRRLMIRALCDCGNYTITGFGDIRSGHTRSCGCLKNLLGRIVAKLKHGESATSKKKATIEYISYQNLKRFLKSKKSIHTTICDRWLDVTDGYKNFLEDMGRKPSYNSRLKRKDKTKDFNGTNCYWGGGKNDLLSSLSILKKDD